MPRGQMRGTGEAIDFADQLLELPLINMAADNLFLGIPKMLNFCYNHKKDEMTTPLKTYLCDL